MKIGTRVQFKGKDWIGNVVEIINYKLVRVVWIPKVPGEEGIYYMSDLTEVVTKSGGGSVPEKKLE